MAEQISSVKAEARTVRIVSKKARLVVGPIRGRSVAEALAILQSTSGTTSPIVERVLKPVIANAEHSYDLENVNLHVSEAYANEGAALKGFCPRVKGMVSPINKRTSHVIAVVFGKND